MKKIILAAVICLYSILTYMPVLAGADEIKVKVNGELVKFDVNPFVENGRTLVPIRSIAEALKFKVDWDAETSTATLSKGDSVVKLVLDSDVALVNGKEVKMDVTAKSKDGRTVVPLRFVSESLGCTVDWFETNRIAAINEKTAKGPVTLFERLIQSEEYERVISQEIVKDRTYAPKDKKAGFILVGYDLTPYELENGRQWDVDINLRSFDVYTRSKVRELLKFIFPKDYETVYMYLIVTLRSEVFEHINESSWIPGVRLAIHENKQVSTGHTSFGMQAGISIGYEGFRSKPEWCRFKYAGEVPARQKEYNEVWNLTEYTIKDYEKVRKNVYTYRAYIRDAIIIDGDEHSKFSGGKYYTYSDRVPPDAVQVAIFETSEAAEAAGFIKDDWSYLYGDYYN